MLFGEESSISVLKWLGGGGAVAIIAAAGHFLPKLSEYVFNRGKNAVALRKAKMDLAQASFNTIIGNYQSELKRQNEKIDSFETKLLNLDIQHASMLRDHEALKKEHAECTATSQEQQKQINSLLSENRTLKARVLELEKKMSGGGNV